MDFRETYEVQVAGSGFWILKKSSVSGAMICRNDFMVSVEGVSRNGPQRH